MRKGWMVLIVLIGSWSLGAEDMPTLNWMGRKDAERATKNVVMKILREDKALSYSVPAALTQRTQSSQRGAKNTATSGRAVAPRPPHPATDNLLVHGDNLEALHALLPFYAGRVKCIYIDPPYNTGSAFEHYDDNLEHATWLNMMYPRLKLLREFLSEDGTIWTSIDDREGAYLRVVCDEIFGRQNFIADVAWEKSDSPRMDAKLFSTRYDHTLVFARNINTVAINQIKVDEIPEHYDKTDADGRRYYLKPLRAMGKNDGREDRPNLFYGLKAPDGSEVFPIRADGSDGNWRWSKAKVDANPDSIAWVEGRKGWSPYYKIYADQHSTRPPETLWSFSFAGSNRNSKSEQAALFGTESAFDTPKPEKLLQRVLEVATNPGDLVLDSFLGSGTTCAVAQKMGRRWIGIEMGEHAKTHCAVRLKKVVDGEQGGISKAVGWKGGGGFRYYELGEAILQKDGTLTADIPFETMAAHVWFTETKRPYEGEKVEKVGGGGESRKKSTVLGVDDGVAYALLYNGILGDKSVSGGNVLTKKTLKVIEGDLAAVKEGADEIKKLIVYAEACRLSDDTLMASNIEFRQTPYDLVVRK